MHAHTQMYTHASVRTRGALFSFKLVFIAALTVKCGPKQRVFFLIAPLGAMMLCIFFCLLGIFSGTECDGQTCKRDKAWVPPGLH